jgi:hypothetical protein
MAVAGEALGQEAAHAGLVGSGQQRVGALCPQPVRGLEAAVEVPQEPQVREGGGLVDDRVGCGFEYRFANGARVEEVERDRLGAERADSCAVPGGLVGADHLVAALDELCHEPGAERAARSCYEDSHGLSFRHIARIGRV